jgi:hypothetical protein
VLLFAVAATLPNLVLPAGALKPGQRYTFRLTVSTRFVDGDSRSDAVGYSEAGSCQIVLGSSCCA